MKNSKVLQHPSTPKLMADPTPIAEECLNEMLPLMIDVLDAHGFDVSDSDFQKDFRIVVEFVRAILFGQLGVTHELQVGLGQQNPLNIIDNPPEVEYEFIPEDRE